MPNRSSGPDVIMETKVSPFIHPGTVTSVESLAIIHLKRDHQIPAVLTTRDDDNGGYDEGKVVNTRFGSFPHSTLIGLPWGSQVRASKVDTGSRGRRVNNGGKRKREESETQDSEQREGTKEAVTASSGFVHLLAPTPENWTSSLPHRTQVVYTPDYSYILQRIRARPGSNIIEAGAGSGSFTHASARAVYNGYPNDAGDDLSEKRRTGKVWSYEFHEQRHSKLSKEIQDHGLDGIVHITHRDVCKEGFLVGVKQDESPNVDAIFLDLPAPWLALPHLTRQASSSTLETTTPNPFISPLNPNTTIYLCTFSPCIEQVQRTVSTMRQLGWVDVSMVEIAQKRLEIRRERIGIENGLQRGVQAAAANVDEAIARLQELEGRSTSFHTGEGDKHDAEARKIRKRQKQNSKNPNSKERIIESLVKRKIYKEGMLTHRAEGELKTHTSYLVFALLPREWTAEQEAIARATWPLKKKEVVQDGTQKPVIPLSKRQMKKAARQAQKDQQFNIVDGEVDESKSKDGVMKIEDADMNETVDVHTIAALGDAGDSMAVG